MALWAVTSVYLSLLWVSLPHPVDGCYLGLRNTYGDMMEFKMPWGVRGGKCHAGIWVNYLTLVGTEVVGSMENGKHLPF